MEKPERLSSLIGEIYDAALDPGLWERVLEQTCDYVVGIAASLISHDMMQKSANFHYTWNDNPDYTKLYLEKYSRINPAIVPAMIQSKVGDVSTYLDFVPPSEYQNSRIYKEWSAPQGYVDAVQAVLDKSAMSFAAAAVMRHASQGPTDEGARQRMQLLTPHFRRAVAIGKVIDLHKVEAASLADTLDGLATAMILVDGGGRIVHANSAGHTLLAEGAVVRMSNGRLAAVDPTAERTLHAIFSNAGMSDAMVGGKGIAVVLERGGERHVAHVLPLTAGARKKAGVAYSAVAAVFVRKAALELPHPLEAIATTFKLTPTEMRVLMMIVEVGGVPEVAPVLGISETTVKTHLQHIFAKTGAVRQADLVKLVAGYLGPLR
jgi:DNA-binding CsgD family transcriptional regulator